MKKNSPAAEPDSGIRLIFVYKLLKSGLELAISVGIFALVSPGAVQRLRQFSLLIRQNLIHAWALAFAEFILRTATPTRLQVASLAVGLDGVLNFFEGWGLYRGYAWGPWLVVVSSGLFLPLEVFEIYRHAHLGRVLIFLVNLWIVIYLIQRALLDGRRREKGRS